MTMELATDPDIPTINSRGWTINFNKQNFLMNPTDCPQTVTIEMEAVGAPLGDQMPVNIIVRGHRDGQQEFVELGGVKVIAENANGTPRPAQAVVSKGIRHLSLGNARLRSTPTYLEVYDMDGGDDDGVESWLGEANFWQ